MVFKTKKQRTPLCQRQGQPRAPGFGASEVNKGPGDAELQMLEFGSAPASQRFAMNKTFSICTAQVHDTDHSQVTTAHLKCVQKDKGIIFHFIKLYDYMQVVLDRAVPNSSEILEQWFDQIWVLD